MRRSQLWQCGLMLVGGLSVGAPGAAAAQNPTSVPGSAGGWVSRFVPMDIWTRMWSRGEERGNEDLVVAAPIDTVWSALKAAFDEHDAPNEFAERASWEIGALGSKQYRRLGKQPLSMYLRCGDGPTGPHAENYVVYLSVVSLLRSSPDTTVRLITLVTAHAVDLAGGRNDPVICGSTGRLEQRIANSVKKRMPPSAIRGE